MNDQDERTSGQDDDDGLIDTSWKQVSGDAGDRLVEIGKELEELADDLQEIGQDLQREEGSAPEE